jgi:hypothetical protein
MSLRAPEGTPLEAAAAEAAAPTGAVPAGGPIRLGIGRIRQTENLWCWVACFHMVLNGSGLSQCEIAQKAFPGLLCCGVGNSPCNIALKPAQIKGLWGELGFADVVARCGHLEPGEIRAELAAGGPIEVWLGRQESCEEFRGDGHVVLIVACEGTTRANMTLTIRDPNPRGGSTEVSYRGLLRNISYGPWVGTWTNIR